MSDQPTSGSELAQRNRELAILSTIAAALNREVHLSPALATTLAHVVELCGLRTGWIPDSDRKSFVGDAILNLNAAITDIGRRRGLDGETKTQQHKHQA